MLGWFESSRASGAPVNLYLFFYGEEDPPRVFSYTDAEKEIEHDGVTYVPVPISRGNIVVSGSMDKSRLEVRGPHDLEVAELFRLWPPHDEVHLVISQGHLSDPEQEFVRIWTGRVLGVARELSEVRLDCEPALISLKRVGLRRPWQHGCPYVLYDSDTCKADKEARSSTAEVTSIAGNTIQVSGWSPPVAENRHNGGLVEWIGTDGQKGRLVIRRIPEPGSFILSGLPVTLQVSMTVMISAGCNRQMSDCADVNDNVPNFGGQEFIPLENPLAQKNMFY